MLLLLLLLTLLLLLFSLCLQGFELHYAVNFLGHFALTQHLLPSLLEQRARVVVVSSILHTYVDDAGPGWSYPSLPSVGQRVWWADLPGLAGGWWAYCRCAVSTQ
jgi:NAD(P)-dependent dehydrogenase (short-subunit alcohol dehydrogenase family)